MKYIVGTGEERKLYDTEKAILLAEKRPGGSNLRVWSKLYLSHKGNYFKISKNGLLDEKVIPMSREEVKNYVLRVFGVDKFIEIFGEVEEA